MKSVPLILASATDIGKQLTRTVSQPGDPKDEPWLQKLLFDHPELLSVESFDVSLLPLTPIGREVPTEHGPIDNLYVSPYGRLVVVETKLWKSPEKHRTVVAQIIDYASQLATWDYDRLDDAILKSSRKRGETERVSLEEKVQSALKATGVPLHEFQEGVAAALSQGDFLLLIIGDRISPNIALLTTAIQSAPGLNFQIGLVELQLYQMSAESPWPLLVVPEIKGRTVEVVRGIVQVRYRHEKPQIAVELDEETPNGGSISAIDLNTFLQGLPRDLVEPFRDGLDQWRAFGGTVELKPRTVFLNADFGGGSQLVIPCRAETLQLISRRMIEQVWRQDPATYQVYLDALEASAKLRADARAGKQWIKYTALKADDIRVLLEAAQKLIETFREAD